MRSGRVRIFNGNQWETLSLIGLTQERIGVEASTLVGIIDVGVDACGILSRSVGQTTGSRNMADIQNIKCNNQRKRHQIAEILHSNGKSGSRNRTAVSKFRLHRKFIKTVSAHAQYKCC